MNTGLIIKTSQSDFTTTCGKVKKIIEDNPNLKLILHLDHHANAQKNDLDLAPTQLFLFGNPKLGTPLMQRSASVALDLPQKILVYEEDGVVKVAYNDPMYLQKRHGITEQEEVLCKVSKALDKITTAATSI